MTLRSPPPPPPPTPHPLIALLQDSSIFFLAKKCENWTIHLRNHFTHCARRGRAGLGTKDVLNFESALIYTKCRSHGSCRRFRWRKTFSSTHLYPRPTPTSFLYGGDITVSCGFIALNLAGNTCLIILTVCRPAMC